MRIKLTGCVVIGFATTLLVGTSFAQTNQTDSNSAVQRAWDRNTAAQQSPSIRIDGGGVSREKFDFHWETRISPASPPLAEGFGTTTTDSMGVIHRVMLDRSGRTYFGYDVLIDVLPEVNTYKVTFKPLVMTSTLAQGWSMDRWSQWIPLSAPRFPAPQNVRGGEILELTLLTNSGTGQRIVDYLSVQEPLRTVPQFSFQPPPAKRDFSYATGVPRDITASDVELRIRDPRLSVNGKQDPSTSARTEEAAGSYIWIYIQDHGRFILSLSPHPGFSKTGEVRGSSLIFMDGSDKYAISSASRIAPGQAAFNLYVLHQPDWKPTYPFADLSAFNMGAEDRIEPLLGK
jgi:hypothetical protein